MLRRTYDIEKVRKLATHAASEVVDKIEIYEHVREALAPYNYVVGTTARLGGERRTISSPSVAAENLVPYPGKTELQFCLVLKTGGF